MTADSPAPAPPSAVSATDSPWQVFLIFLRLGLTSFGGPTAHLGYFRDEFVARRKWLSEAAYADLVALCQFLPGPASSQVGLALGMLRAGQRGAAAAWCGFTLPSALLLILFALGVTGGASWLSPGVLHGLKVAAVAVVAQAVWSMARSLCPDRTRVTLMTLAAIAVVAWPTAWMQVAVIVVAGVAGLLLFRTQAAAAPADAALVAIGNAVSSRLALIALAMFVALLVLLPLAAAAWPHSVADVVDAYYRAGALVFGGGHVVLPLLQTEVVTPGWVSSDAFMAGYGAAQAVPGPLFTLAAFLGAAGDPATVAVSGWVGGFIALLAIFLPAYLLVLAALPFWARVRRQAAARAALMAVNAAVVGLLLAALYDPVWTSAIHAGRDFALALATLVLLMFWRVPAWLAVVLAGVAGGVLA